MSATVRRTIMLRPMRAGVSGYARMQAENSRTLVQLHARGLPEGEVRLFWYLSDRAAREVSCVRVNGNGEASMEAEAPQDAVAPERLQALILLTGGDAPAPLLIGLCVEQSAGSILDAKNAALALCERMRKRQAPAPEPEKPKPAVRPVAAENIPREIFLPALDPAPYARAKEAQKIQREGPGVGRMRPLTWPKGFEGLAKYFDTLLPCRLFDLPGWRFVHVPQGGLWIGRRVLDGRVNAVAYAYRDGFAPAGAPCRPARGTDGATYQVLWQSV